VEAFASQLRETGAQRQQHARTLNGWRDEAEL
jgi:hypothetical protein